ncbi:hypothetical protein CANARDRAFT_25907 [[Candida] arabinofermentans NRRL YB-2248]|uniref:Pre-mRNA-splicing factor CWC2 n=1 Tax=[Candida] arabinofermentans NRRL YB-2248 TaxID=983967 RepID=A0A1E4T7E4_9ASCO|nr:hypothetical protein CANARDRAFT_25907 [[Candida] arabinofermentans NRRL YB-2248]
MTDSLVTVKKSGVAQKKVGRRPARVQLDPATINADSKPAQTGQVFNLWYSKWTGGETNGKALLTHSKTRCHLKQDSGYTNADKHVKPDSINRDKFICLYFARGYCCNGKRCEYLHRLPCDLDFFPPTLDCFGREKFSAYRDDMSGIGSFSRINKTLYVGRINSLENNGEMLIAKNFGEFGDLVRTRVVKDRKIAFVTYKLESQAQFAKEAMHGQSLHEDDMNEALNIRWANEDPDPKAQKREREENEMHALETAKKLLKSMNASEQSEAKRQRTVEVPSDDDVEEEVTTKLIEDVKPAKPLIRSIIKNDSLDVFRQLQLKRTREAALVKKVESPEVANGNSGLQSIIGGYGSSSDDDDDDDDDN